MKTGLQNQNLRKNVSPEGGGDRVGTKPIPLKIRQFDILVVDYGVTLQCHVTSWNDVMTSSDVTKITSFAQKDSKIYDAGEA